MEWGANITKENWKNRSYTLLSSPNRPTSCRLWTRHCNISAPCMNNSCSFLETKLKDFLLSYTLSKPKHMIFSWFAITTIAARLMDEFSRPTAYYGSLSHFWACQMGLPVTCNRVIRSQPPPESWIARTTCVFTTVTQVILNMPEIWIAACHRLPSGPQVWFEILLTLGI